MKTSDNQKKLTELSDNLNIMTRLMEELIKDDNEKGIETDIDLVMEKLRPALSALRTEQLLDLASFCIGICVALGPSGVKAHLDKGFSDPDQEPEPGNGWAE